MSNQFSPTLIREVVEQPLRYFFANYAPEGYRFIPPDDKQGRHTDVIITSVNDFNQRTNQKKPRILIDRGSFRVSPVGLSDNQSSQNSLVENQGQMRRDHMVFVQGTLSILIEAVEEGVCEQLTDMVSTFLGWTCSYIADSYGLKQFGMPLQVSECRPSEEEREIFQTQVSVPWLMEDRWQVADDALRLRDFFLEVKKEQTKLRPG